MPSSNRQRRVLSVRAKCIITQDQVPRKPAGGDLGEFWIRVGELAGNVNLPDNERESGKDIPVMDGGQV